MADRVFFAPPDNDNYDEHAVDMKDYGRWDLSPHRSDHSWGHAARPPATRRVSSPITSPVHGRSLVERCVSSERRSSGSGRELVFSHRPRKSDLYPPPTPPQQTTLLQDFRATHHWPPRGHTRDSALTPTEATELVCSGASTFRGYLSPMLHGAPGASYFFAVMNAEHQARTDRAEFANRAFAEVSLDMIPTVGEAAFPWNSLEQPSMGVCFGKSPGTVTLNYRVGRAALSVPQIPLGGKAKPRKIKLVQILDRLKQLETGLEEKEADLYNYLYSTLIEDPEKRTNPHFAMELQIADLITVLAHSDWINFSLPKNQVVAKFFDSHDVAKKQLFFHQLLLAAEFYLRIHSKGHADEPKRKIITQLPPKIAWDLALAQRWLENMGITKTRTTKESSFGWELRSKKRQKDALRQFAATLKWPNMDELAFILEESDRNEKAVEDRSGDAMSWFTGVILPGPTLPWLLMNSLIDCDCDTGDALKYLTHMQPESGFQYRGNTYWSYRCIVGKVLGAARGVTQVAGWLGPCPFSPDLKRAECVRIRQSTPPREPRLTTGDVKSIASRTDPLGPPDHEYPVDDYEVLVPDFEDVTDAIRVERLSFQIAKDQGTSARHASGNAPFIFDAAIQFACGGDSWPMRLRYDVDFIAAFPCHKGPHVLFYDYAYKAIKVDAGLVNIEDWAAQSRHRGSSSASAVGSSSSSPSPPTAQVANLQVNRVLAIEALGVSDNEVFARAWCAHWGLSAVVANVKDTCVACAVREAYAVCVSVVILTEGGKEEERDLGVPGS